ncbi:MAG: hypothetical protein ACOX8O_07165 [Christensenellales bacterium]|jgi:hypothetical protein
MADDISNTLPAPSEETIQTIGKMRFVVVSRYKENGSTVTENIKRLLEREAQERNEKRRSDLPCQTGYNGRVNTV